MRVFVTTEDSEKTADWVEQLKSLDHQPLTVGGDFVDTRAWFAACRSAVARAECVVIGAEDEDIPASEFFAWVLGYTEALGTQVICVSSCAPAVALANPRNVCYTSFAEAVDNYFSTGRAMNGERAVR